MAETPPKTHNFDQFCYLHISSAFQCSINSLGTISINYGLDVTHS